MKPRKIEYDVGQSAHKQAFVLICVPDSNGGTFTLRREACSQRDESQYVDGLTVEVIRAMAQAAKVIP